MCTKSSLVPKFWKLRIIWVGCDAEQANMTSKSSDLTRICSADSQWTSQEVGKVHNAGLANREKHYLLACFMFWGILTSISSDLTSICSADPQWRSNPHKTARLPPMKEKKTARPRAVFALRGDRSTLFLAAPKLAKLFSLAENLWYITP